MSEKIMLREMPRYLVDTHMHTIASGHAYNTINEMLEKAYSMGMKVICITDHGPKMPGSFGEFYFSNLRVIPDCYYPWRGIPIHEINKVPKLIVGMEANILNYNGDTDYETVGDNIHSVKHIIASMHSVCIEPGSYQENTDAYINAMKKPYVSVLGHIDDGKFPCDYEAIVKTAKEYNILIEVNNSSNSDKSFRLNSKENTLEYLQLCKENEVMVSLGSDAHYEGDIANFFNIIPLLNKVNFPEELIINSNPDLFLDFVEKKYEARLQYYNLK